MSRSRCSDENVNLKRGLAGSLSGICEVTFNNPIERVKVALQYAEQTGSRFSWREQLRLSNLYRGWAPRVMAAGPMRLLYWSTQSITNEYVGNNYYLPRSVHYAIGGMAGGLFQTLIDNPAEVVKTRLMTDTTRTQTVGRIIKESNWRSIVMPGIQYTACRNMFFCVPVSIALSYKRDNDPLYNFCLGGLGGFIGSLYTQPLDYIKTHHQTVDKHGNSMVEPIDWAKMRQRPQRLMKGWFPRAAAGLINMGIGGAIFIEIMRIMSE